MKINKIKAQYSKFNFSFNYSLAHLTNFFVFFIIIYVFIINCKYIDK